MRTDPSHAGLTTELVSRLRRHRDVRKWPREFLFGKGVGGAAQNTTLWRGNRLEVAVLAVVSSRRHGV
jgi:hypothetical protein